MKGIQHERWPRHRPAGLEPISAPLKHKQFLEHGSAGDGHGPLDCAVTSQLGKFGTGPVSTSGTAQVFPVGFRVPAP